jgi:hypothetical protein
VQLLAERIRRNQRVELADHLTVQTGRQISLDRLLGRSQAQLAQAADLDGGEGLIGHVGERLAAPQRERLARVRLIQESLEAEHVHLAVAQLELVAAAAGDDLRAIAVEQPA